MANINPLSTQIAQGQASSQAALSGGKTSVLAGGASGVNFWDFLLGNTQINIQGDTKTADGQTSDDQILTLTDQTALDADMMLGLPEEDMNALLESFEGSDGIVSLMELAALLKSQANEQDLKDLRVERVERRIDQLNKLVNHLTNGIPQTSQTDAAIEKLVSRLDQQIEKLEAKLQDMQSGKTLAEDSNIPLLIALGLTPAQMAKMTQRIEEVEEKLGRELTVDDLIAGVANIIPLPDNKDNLLAPAAANGEITADGTDLTNLPEDTDPSDELAAQLNGLIVGVGNNGSDLQTSDDLGAADGGSDKRVMRGIELLQKIMAAGAQQAGNGAQKTGDIVKSGFSALLNLAGVSGDVTLPAGWYQSFTDKLDFSSFDIQAGLPITSAAQAAHATTAIQQAGQTHPATQLVSAQLTKAAQDGVPKTMTIQMDPPELGRVDIRLEFGDKKSVKAHLIVEKAETYHMLQRDSAFLDRALQNAGLNTSSGDALSFELAQDGSAFDHNNSNNGNERGAANDGNANDETDIIQSTMTWQVDPESGHVRYNILA